MQTAQNAQISIVAIGAELLNGKISDTNSAYIAKSLKRIGVSIKSIRIVSDKIEEIAQALQEALKESSYVVCTGGLGPTSDDVTRDAISTLSKQALTENSESLARLEEYIKDRDYSLSTSNRRQTLFPAQALVIENTLGTADAFETPIDISPHSGFILALPGVPREMKLFVKDFLTQRLESLFDNRTIPKVASFRIFGIAESELGEKISSLALSPKLAISYRPQFPEILLELAAENAEAIESLEEATLKVRSSLGAGTIIGDSPESKLAGVVAEILQDKNLTLACAESCSGGILADLFISIPGASKFFKSSIVSYSNQAKQDLLGVDKSILENYGAVSQECAIAMAQGAREKNNSDFALSITGIAGPGGANEKKSVGTIWIACASSKSCKSWCLNLQWEREMNRLYSSYFAINSLRKHLLTLGE